MIKETNTLISVKGGGGLTMWYCCFDHLKEIAKSDNSQEILEQNVNQCLENLD